MGEPLCFELIGQPLGHSLSPALHALIAEVAGFACEYTLREMPADAVAGYVASLPQSGLAGVNVTIPHKLAAFTSVDALSDEARTIGAVNTIAIQDGGTVGHNTDYYGFGAMLRLAGIQAEGRNATVLGGGGAARACVAWLADHGCDVTLVSRGGSSTLFGARTVGYGALPGGYLLVNATPVGMHPHEDACPLPPEDIVRYQAVADLIYNPPQTVLLRHAAALGLPDTDGLAMLVAQAVRAQQIWQNKPFGEDVERTVLQRLRVLRESKS